MAPSSSPETRIPSRVFRHIAQMISREQARLEPEGCRQLLVDIHELCTRDIAALDGATHKLIAKKLAALVPISNDLIRFANPQTDAVIRHGGILDSELKGRG